MDKRTLSDMARCNRTAMICHLVEASMITITFIAQLLVGSRGLLYSLLVVVLAMGPPLCLRRQTTCCFCMYFR